MATKGVLSEAINKLMIANNTWKEKLYKENNKEEIEKIKKNIQANNAMILDYKFRVEYGDE